MIRNWIVYIVLAIVLACPTAVMSETAEAAAAATTVNQIGTVYADTTTTISGTSDASEVIVKVISPSQLNVFYDIVKTTDGSYSTAFTLSDQAEIGTYTVVAGKGSLIATSSFPFEQRNTRSRNRDSSGSGGGSVSPILGDSQQTQTTVEFTKEDFSKPENGIVTLNVGFANDKSSVVVKLPANLSQLVGDNSLQIATPFGALLFPRKCWMA